MRWTREELQELVKRGSPRGAVAVVGLLRTRPVVASAASPWASSTAPQRRLPSSGFVFFPPAGSLGDVGSQSKCLRPCQGVLRTPSGPPLAASLSTSFSTHSHPFPWASLTHLGPATPVSPSNSPSPALKPEVRAGLSRRPGRMRDGPSAASGLRGGSEWVGASAARTSGTRRLALWNLLV